MAPNPDRELADARACIDRGDEAGAVKRLDRARRGYLKRHDVAGLEHLLVLADVLQAEDERLRIGRDNLLYAIKQNLRLETRRRAQMAGEPWQDPYPDLQAPTEHTRMAVTRGVKFWIALGVGLGTLLIVSVFLAFALFSTSETAVTIRLVNDTGSPATVQGCDDSDCATFWMHADLDRGLSTEREVAAEDVIDYFAVKEQGQEEECLPLRVHDAYEQSGEEASVFVARLSAATPCPGTTVLPEIGAETGL